MRNRSTPLTNKHDEFYSSLDSNKEKGKPQDENNTRLFFISTYTIVAVVFFLTALLHYLLMQSDFMHKQVLRTDPNGELTFRVRDIVILSCGLFVFPLYSMMAFYKASRIWLISILILFPLFVSYYFVQLSILLNRDLITELFISTGLGFAICVLLGLFIGEFFYMKIIGYLKFLVGFFCMYILHSLLHSSNLTWFFAFIMFWLYDFIASDSKKLYHIPQIKNPPLSKTDQLLVSSIAIVLMVPLSGGSLLNVYKKKKR